jgi:putative transposase
VGDLSAKKMASKKKGAGVYRNTKANKTLNHSLQNTGSIGRFIEFLTYKADKVGKRVIRIDESYTSQACCICGKLHNMPLSTRIMNCNCGNQIDRDINSAINIMKRFVQKKSSYRKKYDFLLQQPSMTEESFLKRMDLLRHTAPSLLFAGDEGLAVS